MPTDLTLNVEDKPGELARIAETLGNAGINIEGLAGLDVGGTGILHLLVNDADPARSALAAAGFEVDAERDVECIPVVDQPGEAGRHLHRIADAGVNIDLVYLATTTRLVLGSDDMEGLRKALHGR
jgi:hypothetical protein